MRATTVALGLLLPSPAVHCVRPARQLSEDKPLTAYGRAGPLSGNQGRPLGRHAFGSPRLFPHKLLPRPAGPSNGLAPEDHYLSSLLRHAFRRPVGRQGNPRVA
jgi:hypothetical protein